MYTYICTCIYVYIFYPMSISTITSISSFRSKSRKLIKKLPMCRLFNRGLVILRIQNQGFLKQVPSVRAITAEPRETKAGHYGLRRVMRVLATPFSYPLELAVQAANFRRTIC